jgi:hypothetical protein
MSDEEEKTEAAPARVSRATEGPSPVLLMEEVVENLKLLNYEE